MSRLRILAARLPLKVLAGWLVASMIGWLGVALVGLGIEREVYGVPLTATQVLTVIGGMEGVALVLALTIFALILLIAGSDQPKVRPMRHHHTPAWSRALTPSRERAIASALPQVSRHRTAVVPN